MVNADKQDNWEAGQMESFTARVWHDSYPQTWVLNTNADCLSRQPQPSTGNEPLLPDWNKGDYNISPATTFVMTTSWQRNLSTSHQLKQTFGKTLLFYIFFELINMSHIWHLWTKIKSIDEQTDFDGCRTICTRYTMTDVRCFSFLPFQTGLG